MPPRAADAHRYYSQRVASASRKFNLRTWRAHDQPTTRKHVAPTLSKWRHRTTEDIAKGRQIH